jgi:hypothetical protein
MNRHLTVFVASLVILIGVGVFACKQRISVAGTSTALASRAGNHCEKFGAAGGSGCVFS